MQSPKPFLAPMESGDRQRGAARFAAYLTGVSELSRPDPDGPGRYCMTSDHSGCLA